MVSGEVSKNLVPAIPCNELCVQMCAFLGSAIIFQLPLNIWQPRECLSYKSSHFSPSLPCFRAQTGFLGLMEPLTAADSAVDGSL